LELRTPGPKERASILLVDDLPDKILVYRSVLEELDETLISVDSGPEALKQVLKHDFAVILLDVQMPGMDGFETAQLIRQRKRSAHTPIIFLTAFADEVRTSQGYATGGVDYIATPVVPEILRAKVRVFVELFRMRQQVAHQAEDLARREAAEEAARRSHFLAEASRALATSLDFEATLKTLAKIPVPQPADLSIVCLTDVHGKVQRSEVCWADPAAGVLTETSIALQPWLEKRVGNLWSASKGHEIELLPEAAAPTLCENSTEGAGARPVFQHLLLLPLIARSRRFGTLILMRPAGGRAFDPKDISLLEELSARAANALDNSLLVRDIQEADRHKNEFLAMLAHELRNPLAPIKNAAEVMRMPNLQPQDLAWARNLIERQVTHLVRLVDDLLDVSRITRGKIRLETRTENAADIVASAVETSRPLIEAHKHHLSVSLPDEPLYVVADVTRMAQVLSNLLTNAAKYTPDGGNISLALTRDDELAMFSIRDSGEGIPKEMLAKIFDMFAQVDQSLARSHGGLGVGLTLVRRLVEMHEGSVQAHSEGPGRGSEFIVRIPISTERHPAGGSSGSGSGLMPHYRRRKILLVDDNRDAAESLAVLLRAKGHTLHLVHDGLAALDAAQAFAPDAVLLDIGLPGLNGFQVAQQLRDQPPTNDVLLIAISGYGQAEDLHRSRHAGFNHHLIKPINIHELLKLLAQPAGMEFDAAKS
jgi:signal transduction histidine kinase/DNA-binding response OmpR family regulator